LSDLSPSRIQNIRPETRELILKFLAKHNYTYIRDPELAAYLCESVGSKFIEDSLKLLTEKEELGYKKEGRKYLFFLNNKEYVLKELTKKAKADELSKALLRLSEGKSENFIEDFTRVFDTDDQVVGGHLNIIESLDNEKMSHVFEILKEAISTRSYLFVTTKSPFNERFEEVKPLKLLFLDNNWYLFMEYKNLSVPKVSRLVRLAFIEEVELLKNRLHSTKNHFQSKDLDQYNDFMQRIQSANTRFDLPLQTARVKATPNIAIYFKEGMKKFLKSQRYVCENSDGSVEFEVDYTTDLEVLRLIQNWLPDLQIISPETLKSAYKKKLSQALALQS